MAGSRKALLRKISPHKGTGRYLQYVRCPCCGKLCRAQAIGNAGTHKLSVSQCIRKLPGYRTGWEWGHQEPDREMLGALKESLEAALEQVNGLLGVDQAVLGEPVIPALVGVLGWETIKPEVFSYGDNKGETQGQGETVHPIVQTLHV